MAKILIGVTYYSPHISGLTNYAKILAEELSKRGNKVKVISGRYNINLKLKEKNNGVEIVRIPGQKIGKGFLMWNYPIMAKTMVRENEIINPHLPSVESIWLAIWAKVYHKRLVVTHHCEFWGGNFGNRIIGYFTYPLHWLVYKMADKIVVASQDYAKHSKFLKQFNKKLIYTFPPIKLVKNDEGNTIRKRQKIVGFVGRISWEKGLPYLIKAMEKINAKLELVGPYNQLDKDNTYEFIKNKLGKNVCFLGKISDKELVSFYKKIDCLVLPSINNLEAFGMVQAEAIISGTPVVASNLPGVRVPVKISGMGEISKIADSKDLARKIKLVLKRGKKYYRQKATNLNLFDYRKTVNDYERAFSIK